MKYTYSGSQIGESREPARGVPPHRPAPPRRSGSSVGVFLGVCLVLAALAGAYFFFRKAGDAPRPAVEPSASRGVAPTAQEPAEVSAEQVRDYLTPSCAEIEQLYGYVIKSPFLAENLQYANRMKDVDFAYDVTNDVVNAVGTRRIERKGDEGILHFSIRFFGGAARYARLVGLAAAMEDNGQKGMLKKLLASMPRSFCARCREEPCIRFVMGSDLRAALASEKIRQKAISYSSGTIVSVLAHETGHHALGHLLSFSEKKNLEIDRNQEREADSFASSIISASPFGEYIFAGTLFWHYARAVQVDELVGDASDHPLSKERFENFVRANRDKAEAMGVVLK